MLETARYEANRRLRGTAVLTGAVSLYAGFVVWYFSALEGVDYEDAVQQAPSAVKQAFGIEKLTTIEGFLGAQFFNFVWLLGLGLYFAYTAGSLIAGDIETERMDLLLSFPVSRSRLLAEKVGALLVPLVTINVVAGVVIYAFVIAIGHTIDPARLVLVHLLSIPYLLLCAAIGVFFSVLVDRAAIAERAAVGVIFVLFLMESVVGSSTNFEILQYVSPTHYYEPTQTLLRGSFELGKVGVLLAVFFVVLVLSQFLFTRRDI